jgi:hypothetical protein
MLVLALAALLAAAPVHPAGAATANALCPVTGRDVTNHTLYHHVALGGHVYYVFDREAAIRLKACPSCYLDPEGNPLNARSAWCAGVPSHMGFPRAGQCQTRR